jgi:signal peptidase I
MSGRILRTVLALTLAFVLGIFLLSANTAPAPSYDTSTEGDASCDIRFEEKAVRGVSLRGILEDGEHVLLAYNYYDCNDVELGDIIAYSYGGREVPVIKMVKGQPGDTLSLERQPNNTSVIAINGHLLKNSFGEIYALSEKGSKLLRLYEGIIPDEAYLILGNTAHGSLDSTRFGLVHKSDIIGKVILE